MIRLRDSILMLLAAFFTVSCAPIDTVSLTKDTTLIALRHADRDAGVDELNATGLIRAEALPVELSGYEIDAIFSPGFHRNIQTATPLANATGLAIRNVPEFTMPEQLDALPAGHSAVWIGNKENLTLLWERINAPGEPPLKYGELHIVHFDGAGHAAIQVLQFGPNE